MHTYTFSLSSSFLINGINYSFIAPWELMEASRLLILTLVLHTVVLTTNVVILLDLMKKHSVDVDSNSHMK